MTPRRDCTAGGAATTSKVSFIIAFMRQNRCQIEHKMCPASSKPDFFRLRRAGSQPKEIMKWLQTARRNRLKCELCESLTGPRGRYKT